jgi:predicted RNA binding protein YcfA (HicA-like mRNA interferase family)
MRSSQHEAPEGHRRKDLADLLAKYGYEISRQTGSHLRLRSAAGEGVHSLTIPDHKPLKVGTLSAVLSDVGKYLGMDKQELIRRLFES